jgi:hypothetical protein
LNITVPAGAALARPEDAAVGVQTVPVEDGPVRVKLGTVKDAAIAGEARRRARAEAARRRFMGFIS